MLIFNPKLFLVLALALAGGYVWLAPRAKPKSVDPKAVQWVMSRLAQSTSTLASPLVDGSLERLAAASAARMDAITDMSPPPKPKGPPQNVDELTVDALIKAMEAALFSVPDVIPHLPLLPSLVHDLMRNDPQGVTFGPIRHDAWGIFSTADPNHPRITLSPDLQELHRKGVPTPLLAAVLVHELDHLLMYMGGRGKGTGRNDKEYTAFRSEGLYLSSLFHGHNGDAVDAVQTDDEKDAYYRDLKKIRQKMFSGELPQMIKEAYGPDPGSSPSPSQQKR